MCGEQLGESLSFSTCLWFIPMKKGQMQQWEKTLIRALGGQEALPLLCVVERPRGQKPLRQAAGGQMQTAWFGQLRSVILWGEGGGGLLS